MSHLTAAVSVGCDQQGAAQPGINKVTLTGYFAFPLHPLLGSAAKLTVE